MTIALAILTLTVKNRGMLLFGTVRLIGRIRYIIRVFMKCRINAYDACISQRFLTYCPSHDRVAYDGLHVSPLALQDGPRGAPESLTMPAMQGTSTI